MIRVTTNVEVFPDHISQVQTIYFCEPCNQTESSQVSESSESFALWNCLLGPLLNHKRLLSNPDPIPKGKKRTRDDPGGKGEVLSPGHIASPN